MPTTPAGAGSNIAPIAGGVAAGSVVILAIAAVAVAILVVCCCKRRHTGKSGDLENYDGRSIDPITLDPFYSEVNKPPPPPLPSCFDTSTYASIDSKDRNGSMELFAFDRSRSSVPPSLEGTPMPIKLQNTPEFLQRNPMYLSADHLNRDDSFLRSQQRQFGSLPALEGSMLNIYAASTRITHAAPPQFSPPGINPIYSESGLSPAVFRASTSSSMASSASSAGDVHPYSAIYADPRPLRRSEGPLEVNQKNICEKQDLGMGQFGQVVLAETLGISLRDLGLSHINDDKNITVQVAMKKLKRNPDRVIKEAFEKEIKFMSRLKHNNVVRLLAICSTGDPFILMEYMENGDLNQYLRKCDIALPEQSPADNRLPPAILLYMALQISSGMRYLASLKFVHRDLATRNCLVGEQHTIKIADFGMSRSLYDNDYYRIRGRAMLPIRWMANDCFYGRFSEKTDVWAFGVSMWEIFTFAKRQPYEHLTDQQVIDEALKGDDRAILSRPDTCPEEVFDVMVRCWVVKAEERADFEELYASLSALHSYSDLG